MGRSNESGWGKLGCQGGCGGRIRPCGAFSGCWEFALWLGSQKSGGMGARFGRPRSKLMWESGGRGAFGACVAARRARSVAIEGGGCIGPRRAAHKNTARAADFKLVVYNVKCLLVHLGFGDRGPVAISPRRLSSWDTTRTLPTPLVDSERPRTPMSVPRAAPCATSSCSSIPCAKL